MTETGRPAGGYKSGSQYIVTADDSELPKGSHFVLLPGAVRAGELALIVFAEELLITGRWFPGVDGSDWIAQPGRLIKCSGEVSVRVLGRIIPNEPPPAQITNLREGEYEHLFDNPFPRRLDS